MTEVSTEQHLDADGFRAEILEDPHTPLESLDPVELVEVDEDGPEPPAEWGVSNGD